MCDDETEMVESEPPVLDEDDPLAMDGECEGDIDYDDDNNFVKDLMETSNDSLTDNQKDELSTSKTEVIYRKCYDDFMKWSSKHSSSSLSESSMIEYFDELSKTLNSATLWSKYSMLKRMLASEDNIDISKFCKLRQFLKKLHADYKAKKAEVLTPQDIDKFLKEAPDDKYLPLKVAMILGISGACRRNQLYELTIDNFQILDSLIIVTIPDKKTHLPKSFVIQGKYYDIITKYVNARSADVNTNKFFLCYRNGRCNNQAIGKNTIGNMPKTIAEYLKLPNSERYTGHSFRRTSSILCPR